MIRSGYIVKYLRAFDNYLSRIVNVALVALFVLMAGLSVLQVVMRYFFNGGLLWGDIAARALVIWVGLLGAVLAIRDGKHFHIDVLTRFLGERQRPWFQILSHGFASVICYLLGGASLTFIELDSGGKTFLNLPLSLTESILPVGFYLMTLQFALRALMHLVEGRSAEETRTV